MKTYKKKTAFDLFKGETIKIAKEKKMKYAILWVDSFLNELSLENNYLSVELIKNSIDEYYKNIIKSF